MVDKEKEDEQFAWLSIFQVFVVELHCSIDVLSRAFSFRRELSEQADISSALVCPFLFRRAPSLNSTLCGRFWQGEQHGARSRIRRHPAEDVSAMFLKELEFGTWTRAGPKRLADPTSAV